MQTTATENKCTAPNIAIVMFYESWACFLLLCIRTQRKKKTLKHCHKTVKPWEACNKSFIVYIQTSFSTFIYIVVLYFAISFEHSLFFYLLQWGEISDENVHLINFIHQICCMKCVFIQRAAGGVGVRKNHLEIVSQFIVLHFAAIVFEDQTLWIFFRNPFCVFSSSSSECSFVCLFVCIKACQHLCQKIFFARFWDTQAHRIARIRYKQKWYCTCRKTMCRFFKFGVVCTGNW